MDTDQIQARIAALTQERDTLVTTSNELVAAFTANANRQISFLEGKIAALQELITPPPEPAPEPPIQAHEKVKRGKDRTPLAEPLPVEELHTNGVEVDGTPATP